MGGGLYQLLQFFGRLGLLVANDDGAIISNVDWIGLGFLLLGKEQLVGGYHRFEGLAVHKVI